MARPKKKVIRVSIGASVRPEIDRRLDEIAEAEDRTKSSVIEKLLARGIAAYLRDGELEDFSPEHYISEETQEILKKSPKEPAKVYPTIPPQKIKYK